MSCYLCAYQRIEVPQKGQPLPAGSPVAVHDDLATCSTCRVWACSLHGTRYGVFECAICMPASATKRALIAGAPPSVPGAAAAVQAHQAGTRASEAMRGRVAAALNRVRDDHQKARIQAVASLVGPTTDEPNVVGNLAEVIRKQADLQRGFVFNVRGRETSGTMAIEPIAAAVRTTFGSVELAEFTPEVVVTVTGALILATQTADAGSRATLASRVLGPQEIPAPWTVTHPALLDPVLWMVGTAYQLVP